MEELVKEEDLLASEEDFLQWCMPHCSFPSQAVLGTPCCDRHCVLHVKRLDILIARYHFQKFTRSLNGVNKKNSRRLFVRMISRVSNGKIVFIPLSKEYNICSALLARTFGFSVNTLIHDLSGDDLMEIKSRPWYSKSIERLSSALLILSLNVQFNSLNQLMVPSNFVLRMPEESSEAAPISELRVRMDLNVRQRKSDTLTRCVACVELPEMMKKGKTVEEKKDAELMLKLHHVAVSRQRVLIECLCKQSRESDFDISVCLMDSMSNRHTKLPFLLSRPKTIGDTERIPISLTTVQLAQKNGDFKLSNIECPTLQGMYSHCSSFNVSVLLGALRKFQSIGSTIFVLLDSAPNNKSFLFFAGIGHALTKLKYVEKITLIYPAVGHTHLSVDSHFGVVSKAITTTDIKDPIEFGQRLQDIPSVLQVVEAPTVYDFSEIAKFVNKPPGLCSNGVVNIFKSQNGKIHYTSALTLHATQLVGSETGDESRHLFSDEYYLENLHPLIVPPTTANLKTQIDKLMNDGSYLFTDTNRANFEKYLKNVGSESFRQLVHEINSIPVKVSRTLDIEADPQMTVVEFLRSKGVNMGRVPKNPSIRPSDLVNDENK